MPRPLVPLGGAILPHCPFRPAVRSAWYSIGSRRRGSKSAVFGYLGVRMPAMAHDQQTSSGRVRPDCSSVSRRGPRSTDHSASRAGGAQLAEADCGQRWLTWLTNSEPWQGLCGLLKLSRPELGLESWSRSDVGLDAFA
jgi:hypothetical protein